MQELLRRDIGGRTAVAAVRAELERRTPVAWFEEP